MGYWYVEVLVQTLALLFAVPAVRRVRCRYPFAFALGALLVALAARSHLDPGNEYSDRFMSTLVGWLFVLGWVAYAAVGPARRTVALGLVLLLVPGFFDDPRREGVVVAGLVLLRLVPCLPVPRAAVRLVGLVAASSLYTYLTHYAVYAALLPVLPPEVVVAACLVVGFFVWSVAHRWVPRWAGWLARLRTGGPASPAARCPAPVSAPGTS